MADPKIKFKRSSVQGKSPTATDLPLGEIAINTYDGIVYTAKSTDGGLSTSIVNVSGVQLRDEDTPVGYANTINFTGAGILASVQNGIGIVTVSSTGSSSQWITTATGIHTLSNVGIGTTNPTSKLTVDGDVNVSGIVTATDFNSTSDLKLKTNVQKIENPLDKIVKINGVTFNWKENNKQSIGVIAQEIEKVLPQLVSTGENKTVNYNGIIGLLIECVKEQQGQINELREELKSLKT